MKHLIRSMAAFTTLVVLVAACELEPDPEAGGTADTGVEREVDEAAPANDDAAPTTTTAAATTESTPSPTTTATTPTTTSTPSPTSTTTAPTTTSTLPPSTTAPPTTTEAPPTTTTAGPGSDLYFSTLPPGSPLPSGEWCASRVKAAPETRPGNATFNATRGTATNDWQPRVDGNFVGTTDEIIQWAACKWGIDEDIDRAQSAKESWWDMSVGGDLSWDQNECHPDLRTGEGTQCPESIGLLQVRWLYHSEAFEDSNAILSTAYNADYTYAVWRYCFEGDATWLNDVERGADYSAGDVEGCLGVWFSGRWYVDHAVTYIAAVNDLLNDRVWEQPYFLNF